MRLSALFAACIVIVASVVAQATVVLEADVQSLADACSTAVIGTVRSKTTVIERRPLRIWTEVVVDVDETLLGEETGRVTVSIPGGSAGGLTQEIHGVPHMRRGQRVVLFLWQDGDRQQVLGMAQGCLHVRRRDGIDVCRADLGHLTVVRKEGQRGAPRTRDIPVADVRRTVRAAVQRRAEKEARRRRRIERRLEEARRSAERNAERTRGRPGGATR